MFALISVAPTLWQTSAHAATPAEVTTQVLFLVPPTHHAKLKPLRASLDAHLSDLSWRLVVRAHQGTTLAHTLARVKQARRKTPNLRAVAWLDNQTETFLTIYICNAAKGEPKLITRALSKEAATQTDEVGLILRQILPGLPKHPPTPRVASEPRVILRPPPRKAQRFNILSTYAVAADVRVGMTGYAREPVARGHLHLGMEARLLRHISIGLGYIATQHINEALDPWQLDLDHRALKIGVGHYWAFLRGRFHLGMDMLRETSTGTITTPTSQVDVDEVRWIASPNASWHHLLSDHVSANLYVGMHIAPRGISYAIGDRQFRRWRVMPFVQMSVHLMWESAR